mmetsp:Transcript_20984/g.60637  ORF Transcript_20984/g.60637 Transcript_20984/m.60637 type:complete len:387 (-) Transcript_20984:49-1209(-)
MRSRREGWSTSASGWTWSASRGRFTLMGNWVPVVLTFCMGMLMVSRTTPEYQHRNYELQFGELSAVKIGESSIINHGLLLGAVVFLAPQRHEYSIWEIDRFCLLLRAVRSVDRNLNSIHGPYPIYILVARDYELDPRHKDGLYSEKDRDLIRRWAPRSTIHFVEIEMYSGDALEPDTYREKILKWRRGEDGAVAGRDLGYTSMCRLWSGRLQSMSFLNDYKYYLRMDDDSLLMSPLSYDPFQRMEEHGLEYAFRSYQSDEWGIDQLWAVTKPFLSEDEIRISPFLVNGESYDGSQPYNNFHISTVAFWRDHRWQEVWNAYNKEHLFFKYRVGDANVHAMALTMMQPDRYALWDDMPYVHNSNDYKPWWQEAKSWREECKRDYQEYL